MCSRPSKDFRAPSEEHRKDVVWCNKIPVSKRNCTLHVGLIPASKTNIKEAKTYYTYELLCISIVDPPQHATIVVKSDSGASDNYWCTEDTLVLTNLKYNRDGPTVQLPNNATMNATKTESIPLQGSRSTHKKKSHVFDGINIPSLISLGQLYDDEFIAILDKNEINILKNNTVVLRGHRNRTDVLWDIPISIPLIHLSHEIITGEKTKTELIQYLNRC